MKRISTGAMAALCTVTLLSIGTRSRAQLASSLTTSGTSAYNGDSAGQFTLTNDVTVSSAVLSLTDQRKYFGDGGLSNVSDLTASLYMDSGNTIGSLVASSTGVSGTLTVQLPIGTPSGGPITFTFGEPELSAGTYWLELQQGGGSDVGWIGTNSSLTNTGTDGTVNHLTEFYSTYADEGLLFSVNGDEVVSSTPEPGSIALLGGMGLTSSMLLLRRRKKSAPAK